MKKITTNIIKNRKSHLSIGKKSSQWKPKFKMSLLGAYLNDIPDVLQNQILKKNISFHQKSKQTSEELHRNSYARSSSAEDNNTNITITNNNAAHKIGLPFINLNNISMTKTSSNYESNRNEGAGRNLFNLININFGGNNFQIFGIPISFQKATDNNKRNAKK